jgi:putative SOS response-associated peptidase YedK
MFVIVLLFMLSRRRQNLHCTINVVRIATFHFYLHCRVADAMLLLQLGVNGAQHVLAAANALLVNRDVATPGNDARTDRPLLTWGLIPSWSTDGKGFINARCETLEAKPSFSESFQQRRCLIPADGFFEWRLKTQYPARSRALPWLPAHDGLWILDPLL